MAQIFMLPNGVGWWATPLFVVPLFTTRLAYHRYVETRELFEQTIGALANAVDARDRYTRGHSNRVSHIAEAMCRVMKLPETEIEKIKWAGLLHDVGKIGIRDNILLKEGPLDREERILMNQHPSIGAEIVAPASQLKTEAPLIRAHHEWFNGSGYPDGIEALDIPLGARILTIADAYEAMTSSRPYRKIAALATRSRWRSWRSSPASSSTRRSCPSWLAWTARPRPPAGSDRTSCRPCSTHRIPATSRWRLPPLSPTAQGHPGGKRTVEASAGLRRCSLASSCWRWSSAPWPAGGIPRLADLRLKLVWVLGLALALRFGAVLLAGTDVGADLPVGAAFVVAYLLLFVFLAANYTVPGLQVAAVGIGLNTLAVILNAGQMPIWANAFEAAGFSPAALVGDPFHFLIASGTWPSSCRRAASSATWCRCPSPSSGTWSASATSCWRWASSGPSSTP